MRSKLKEYVIKENPVFGLFLGMCSTLAISTTLNNAIGMGLSVTIILMCSNVIISALRKMIPDEIRIPVYIVVIATLVSILQMVMHAYMPSLYKSLGAFLSLIVVNCIILGRAEAFASKNPVKESLADGFLMGLGYLVSLVLVSLVRELLATMSLSFANPMDASQILFKLTLPFANFKISLFADPVGAFFTFAVFAALFAKLKANMKDKEEKK